MWRVIRRDALRSSDFSPLQSSDVTPEVIEALAADAAGETESQPALTALRDLIARSRSEDESTRAYEDARVPILEPIRRWAEEAVRAEPEESTEGHLIAFDAGLGLVENEELWSFAWHGHEVAVIPIEEGTRSIELTYRPSRDERVQRDFIYNSYAKGLNVTRWWPWPEVELSVDVLRFLADDDAGWVSIGIQPRSSEFPRQYRFQLDLASRAAGFLVVKPLYRLARNLRVRARDPLFAARTRRDEERIDGLPPRLESTQPSDGQLIVLVHGLGSTAIEMAELLQPLSLDAVRFEHDTFISIDDNADELATLLTERGGDATRIILICHSRGGLVARAAADLLPADLAARTDIHTFGTPHLGTPLAEFARLVPLIHGLDFLRHASDVLRAADHYLLPRTWRTPEGIEEMSPNDVFIRRMTDGAHKQLGALNVWGAEYQDGCSTERWCRFLAGLCEGILALPHDLVVPQPSSLGAGIAQGPLTAPSTHFDYLRLQQVQEYIKSVT